MSRLLFLIALLLGGTASAQPKIALSPPQVTVDSIFFEASARVQLELGYPGVQLRYTLDGSPVLPESPQYNEPLRLSQTTQVRARAFHPDFADSREVSVTVRSLKHNQRINVVEAAPKPAPRYAGAGLPALTDQQKGALNFAATPGAWLGWETDTLHLWVETEHSATANQLTLSLLDNAGAWIMPPAWVQVYEADELVGEAEVPVPQSVMPTAYTFLEVPLLLRGYKRLHVLVCSQALPEWHDGAGRPAWIFMDEVFLSQTP